jgi:hypothetical protein
LVTVYEVGQAIAILCHLYYSDIRLRDLKDYGLKKLVSMVLIPLPTELAGGLRLEGVSLED